MNLLPFEGLEKTSQLFRWQIVKLAEHLGASPDALAAVMFHESGFSPSIRNTYRCPPGPDGKPMASDTCGAVGLIQFMPDTCRLLGTVPSEMAAMTREEQMPYVRQFFDMVRKGKPLTRTVDVYLAALGPFYIGKSYDTVIYAAPDKRYVGNSGLDVNKDGKLTVAEMEAVMNKDIAEATARVPLVGMLDASEPQDGDPFGPPPPPVVAKTPLLAVTVLFLAAWGMGLYAAKHAPGAWVRSVGL